MHNLAYPSKVVIVLVDGFMPTSKMPKKDYVNGFKPQVKGWVVICNAIRIKVVEMEVKVSVEENGAFSWGI